MNILEMVDYFMEQGMNEEQANELANAEWQARKINEIPVKEEPVLQSSTEEEKLYLVDDTMYLHVQPTEGGWDYSLYDKENKKLLDGGIIETADIETSPVSSLDGAVRTEIFAVQGMTPTKVIFEDISILDELVEAQNTEIEAVVSAQTADPIDEIAREVQEDPPPYKLPITDICLTHLFPFEKLEDLYRIFNIEHPQGFTGHSLSISDIVALKQAGVVSYHYVDSVGYKELHNFRNTDNHLKNAEMQLEDDYGMIDGVINNGPKQTEKPAPKKEETKAKKPSVLAKLRKYQAEDRQQTTQHRSAERDLI